MNEDTSRVLWEHIHEGEDRRMPLEQLSQTIEFLSLTKKQKLCVATYISNGYDIVNAIRTAYPCKNDQIAAIMQHRFFNAVNVTLCLCRHFQTDPKQDFLIRLVKAIIKGKVTREQIKMYELYAEVNQWRPNALLEAAQVARELGYKVNKSTGSGLDATNVTTNIIKAIKKGNKNKPTADYTFDLSDF